jgi:hypothetical protein
MVSIVGASEERLRGAIGSFQLAKKARLGDTSRESIGRLSDGETEGALLCQHG